MSIQAKRISEAAPRSDGERTVSDRLHAALRRAREQVEHAETAPARENAKVRLAYRARDTQHTDPVATADVVRRHERPTRRRPHS